MTIFSLLCTALWVHSVQNSQFHDFPFLLWWGKSAWFCLSVDLTLLILLSSFRHAVFYCSSQSGIVSSCPGATFSKFLELGQLQNIAFLQCFIVYWDPHDLWCPIRDTGHPRDQRCTYKCRVWLSICLWHDGAVLCSVRTCAEVETLVTCGALFRTQVTLETNDALVQSLVEYVIYGMMEPFYAQ